MNKKNSNIVQTSLMYLFINALFACLNYGTNNIIKLFLQSMRRVLGKF
ncbi:30051_t:CDS:1, partial [Gigaspora margarita]